MCDLPSKLVIAAVSLATVAALPGYTSNANAQAVKADSRALTQMSHEAVRIFDDAGMAATALNNGNKVAAQRDINMAMAVRDRLAVTARSHNLPKVVPVYSEAEQSTAFGTVLAKKNNGQPVSPAKDPVTVDSVKDQFTFVGVDLDKSKVRLQSAKEAIQNNNLQAAKDTLNSIGEDLVVVKVGADAPLLAVRENLGLAQLSASKMSSKETTAALQQASTELTAYSQQNGPHQQDAKNLAGKIEHMLSVAAQKESSSAATIGNWWSQVNSWIQTPAA